jgi:hypothetical protein
VAGEDALTGGYVGQDEIVTVDEPISRKAGRSIRAPSGAMPPPR